MSLATSPVNLGSIHLQQARQDEVLAQRSRAPTSLDTGRSKMDSEHAALKKSTQEFEAMFLELVLKTMRDSVQKSGLVDGGNAEDIYKSMLDSEYAKTLAAQGSTGIAASMERQLLERFGKEVGTANEPKSAVTNAAAIAGLKTYAEAAEKPKDLASTGREPLQSMSKQAKINLLMP